ncbi:MAG: PAS domain S-box protein [Gammaproteobacteria bacterium]|nr:PAS domain S-box protein [Gammaproteobacteria bacterium]
MSADSGSRKPDSISDNGGANFRALLQAAVDAIIVIDEAGSILQFNPAAERIFGFSQAEVLGRNVSMLMPPHYAQAHDGYMAHYHATGERRIIGIGREVEARRRDGTVFPIELSVGQVDLPGASHYVGIIRDISARKRAEQEMRELQERLARVGRFSTMGEMAAGLAHEINQPLGAINTYAQAASRMISAGGSYDIQDMEHICRQVSEQARRAGEVIRRLRGFLRTEESGRQRLDCNSLIREIMFLAEIDAREHGVPLALALADDLPTVDGTAVEIQQVILNLIRNAVDAMSGQPDRSRGVIIATARGAEGGVECSVTDHGPGVAADIAGQIFHPFVTSKRNGLGVGLSISRTIIHAHGGKLSFVPNPAGGTIFSFHLPEAFED